MVYPALAAVAVALAEGVSLEHALAALAELSPTRGRLETVALANGAFVVRDDYKGLPETIDAALDVLAEIPARRRIVVLGDVEEAHGPVEPLYARLGERVASIAARGVFLHHYEEGPRYTPSAAAAGLPVVDARGGVHEAIAAVAEDLGPGDVVLVKGGAAQRLDRVSLALAGRQVGCELRACVAHVTRCDVCPMLERGWNGRRGLM
jgi:UDP-N-acetylmuramyl pentapeptide synthase